MVTPEDPTARQLDFSFEEQQSARRVWPVSELVERVRELVEQKYTDVSLFPGGFQAWQAAGLPVRPAQTLG